MPMSLGCDIFWCWPPLCLLSTITSRRQMRGDGWRKKSPIHSKTACPFSSTTETTPGTWHPPHPSQAIRKLMRKACWYNGAAVLSILGGDGATTLTWLPDKGQCQWQESYKVKNSWNPHSPHVWELYTWSDGIIRTWKGKISCTGLYIWLWVKGQ